MGIQHKAMVLRQRADTHAPYWAGVGPWRDSKEAAKKDADAHRLETNPIARIRIYTLTTEDYNG